LELVRSNDYAVVATDYRMPDKDGLELMTEIRPLQPNATYMLVSGQCDLEVACQAVNDHDVAFVVTKPWDSDQLGSLLRRALEAAWERNASAQVHRNLVGASRELDQQQERLHRAMQQSEESMAEILLNALDLREHETRSHCRRVAEYALILAGQLGLSGRILTSIYRGALLHDLGKIGVPDAILQKPGPLDDAEWAVMRDHPRFGAQILEGVGSLSAARAVVLQHHERWDGQGYPARLKGTEIAMSARVFAVCDAFDAMMSWRPYRDALSFADARDRIALGSGSQFDPEIVAAFMAVPESTWRAIRTEFPDDEQAPAGDRAA
jgi:putative nucleotidyltransferase with HDIG domain